MPKHPAGWPSTCTKYLDQPTCGPLITKRAPVWHELLAATVSRNVKQSMEISCQCEGVRDKGLYGLGFQVWATWLKKTSTQSSRLWGLCLLDRPCTLI